MSHGKESQHADSIVHHLRPVVAESCAELVRQGWKLQHLNLLVRWCPGDAVIAVSCDDDFVVWVIVAQLRQERKQGSTISCVVSVMSQLAAEGSIQDGTAQCHELPFLFIERSDDAVNLLHGPVQAACNFVLLFNGRERN